LTVENPKFSASFAFHFDNILQNSKTKISQILLSFLIQQLQLAQMSADMSRDELHGLSVSGGESSSGGGASPLTARSIRLERFAQALANSQEELRR
jgi:hypothetical protein